MSGQSGNQKLRQWVDQWAAVLQPDDVYWCDGSADEYEPLCAGPRRLRHVHDARRGQAPEQLLGPLRPRRRRPRRGPHVHLLDQRARRRPEQQLAPARRDARRDDRALHRRHEGPHDVRRAVLDGPARLPHRPHRRAAHRLGLRRRQHADHDPHGPGRARRPRRRPASSSPASTPSAPRSPPGEADVAVAVQPGQQVHRPLPGDPGDPVVRLGLRRQRPARQEVLRPAHRLGDGPRRRLAGRAHAHPQADQPGSRSRSTSPPRSRRRAARPTWRCSCRRSRAGRPRPSATTSAG